MVAEIFVAADAGAAALAGVAEPGHADALADLEAADAGAETIDPSDDFMAGNDRDARVGQFAVDDMEIGAADAAGRDFQADFAGAGQGIGTLRPFERRADPVENHGMHQATSPCAAVSTGRGDGVNFSGVFYASVQANTATEAAPRANRPHSSWPQKVTISRASASGRAAPAASRRLLSGTMTK